MFDSSNDPFARPRSGSYPSVEDLEGKLLLIEPETVEVVPNKFAKGPEDRQTVKRATANVTVFGEADDDVEEYTSMYLSQTVLISACEGALKPGAKPMALGRLVKLATKDTREKLKIEDTPEAFAAAREKWLKGGGKGPEPKHVWVLQDFTDEDANRVRAYLTSKAPFANAE